MSRVAYMAVDTGVPVLRAEFIIGWGSCVFEKLISCPIHENLEPRLRVVLYSGSFERNDQLRRVICVVFSPLNLGPTVSDRPMSILKSETRFPEGHFNFVQTTNLKILPRG
jgi:hypothetical protein